MLFYSLLIASFVPAIFAYPYNVGCDGMTKDKSPGGPAPQMWTTATTIMGKSVVDDNNIISADKTTVAVGEKVTITAVTDGGQKLIYNKDGTTVGVGNLFQRTTDHLNAACAGKAVYESGADANPKAQWTAPDAPGTYTIWAGYAPGYGAVTRGKIEVTVTAAGGDTPTQTSATMAPMSSSSAGDTSADDTSMATSSMASMASPDASPDVSDDSSANTAMFTAAFVITAITFLFR